MKKNIVGLTGSFTSPSRTASLVNEIVSRASQKYDLDCVFHNLSDLGSSFGRSLHPGQLDETARSVIQDIIDADVLVVGTPTYQASYPGMFKHLFDLIDPYALVGKPVILSATGGSERHALMLEHQLRPLFHYFRSASVPTAIYAASSEFEGLELRDEGLLQRINRAVEELTPLILTLRSSFTEQNLEMSVSVKTF